MTSIFKTPYGEMQQFVQNLHSGGFSYEDVARVIKEPNLASVMYASIQPAHLMTLKPWYVGPDQQVVRARELWPDAVLPKAPMSFVPQTDTAVLLLHVPDTFDSLWRKVVAPTGYTKNRWKSLRDDNRHLRLAPNKVEFTEPVWLAFDPEHGRGEKPDALWGQDSLAASEVLSALIQFPSWPLAWFNDASAPNLSGYQLEHDGEWSSVPYLSRWDGGEQLDLVDRWAGSPDEYWASPSVREVLSN
jgi:hypothetical protein